jgi:cyclopropane-fatty-acyl-phospholipid synthase
LHDLPSSAQRRYNREGLFGLGESFIKGEWSAPDLEHFLHHLVTSSPRRRRLPTYVLPYVLKELVKNPQKGEGAFEVARRHYDLGNELFSAMLDSTMSYTCGYWKEARTLEEAQIAKLDLACRQMELQPGMTVLDIGCGWGNWAQYAARHYGVKVVGLTVSTEQAELARKRCAGLPVEILLQDYQTFHGKFDRIVSIEMIEAVGKRNLPHFFRTVDRCLVPGGRFLLQVISGETFSSTSHRSLDEFVLWLRKYIFPNGYLPKMREITALGGTSLVIERMHNFAPDYERTLLAWHSNFEAAWPSLQSAYGEEFHRMWRYYLLGCAAMFRAGMVQLYQVLYRR